MRLAARRFYKWADGQRELREGSIAWHDTGAGCSTPDGKGSTAKGNAEERRNPGGAKVGDARSVIGGSGSTESQSGHLSGEVILTEWPIYPGISHVSLL